MLSRQRTGNPTIDLLILNARVGPYDQDPPDDGSIEDVENLAEEEGIRTIAAVHERRFVPVVFHMGLVRKVGAMESPVAPYDFRRVALTPEHEALK